MFHSKFVRHIGSLCVFGLMAAQPAWAQAPAEQEDEEFFVFDEEEAPPIADPLERVNRATFAFNDKAYRYVLKPVARGLRILPEGLRTSINNFFDNLVDTPMSAVSALLQADIKNAGSESARFLLNSTAGLAGFFDVATRVGIEKDEEDLGQTLGRWGVGPGVYVVLPFVGPSSLRDFAGFSAQTAINPLYDNLHNDEIIAINVVQAEVALSLDRDTYEGFYDDALDPYVFFRSAWQQNREGAIEQ